MGIFFFFFFGRRPELSRRAERSHRVTRFSFFESDTLSSRAILLPLLLPQILIWGVGGS